MQEKSIQWRHKHLLENSRFQRPTLKIRLPRHKMVIASWPVSRVLYGYGVNRNVAAIPLGQRSHAASRNPP
ncbi:hypothetical protein ACC673_38095, partial [Rhizobium ruizarguesonis]